MDGVGQTYAQDSFFTLSVWGQIGLGLLSAFLSIFAIWLVWRMSRGRATAPRFICALIMFWLFVWLSPQAYYLYYWLIFSGLPMQWVLKLPPSPVHLLRLIGFSAEATLSHHSQGILGWAMMAAGLWPQRKTPGV